MEGYYEQKIGVKITVMMVVMTIMYLITSVASGFVQEQLAQGIPTIIAETQQYFTEMYAIVDGLETNDMVGVTKEEVRAKLEAYEVAVAAPAKNANDMIAFIDETVLTDYDKFVGMANTYHSDADYMDEILQNFYVSAERLRGTMAQMAEGIDGINIAVDESAQGVTSAAQSTGALVEALINIKGEADINREISEGLQDEVGRFKNI